MDERLTTLLSDLARAETLSGADFERCARRGSWVAEFTEQQVAEFLTGLGELPLPLAARADRLLALWLGAAVQSRRKRQPRAAPHSGPLPEGDEVVNTALIVLPVLERVYRQLGSDSRARSQLLAWLAAGQNPVELESLGRLLVEDPPQEEQDIMQVFAHLFRSSGRSIAVLFPRLLDALAHPALAAPVLDLANYVTREKVVAQHPARERAGELAGALGELVQSLFRLEEQPQETTESPQELGRLVSQGVALAVSLCDSLGLIGDLQAIGKLNQAMDVRHRRLRTEAAAALARLGESRGEEALAELAAEPVARLRVLAYAKELGIADKIDPQFVTPEARAEAELCVWLAEPTQYGLPPTSCELVDHRRQHWPGYTEPVDCYLFRFQYVVTVDGEQRSLSNIGIAGPLAHAFLADLGDLPPQDIYAAFAGWQAQHAEIREFDVERLSRSEQLEAERLKRRLVDAGYTAVEPLHMGYFFGEKALVALAQREAVPGVAVADFQETAFFPQRHSRRPLGANEVYCIYKGRKLLAAFNRPG